MQKIAKQYGATIYTTTTKNLDKKMYHLHCLMKKRYEYKQIQCNGKLRGMAFVEVANP